jgi:hypothetical protein
VKRLFLIAALAAGVLAPAAQAKLIGSASASGPAPFADASAELARPAGPVTLKVSASTGLPVDIAIDLQCERGIRHRRVSYKLPTATAPLTRRIALPIKKADRCNIDIDAGYHEEETEEAELHPREGEITVQLFGTSSQR